MIFAEQRMGDEKEKKEVKEKRQPAEKRKKKLTARRPGHSIGQSETPENSPADTRFVQEVS